MRTVEAVAEACPEALLDGVPGGLARMHQVEAEVAVQVAAHENGPALIHPCKTDTARPTGNIRSEQPTPNAQAMRFGAHSAL